MSLQPIHVLGLSPGGLRPPAGTDEILASAEVLCGGRRLLEHHGSGGADIVPVAGPLDKVMETLERAVEAGRRVVVLADGDPLFFGLGARLAERFGAESLVFHPGVSTVQTASARVGLDHSGIRTVSLHGRNDLTPLWSALCFEGRAFVYTDPVNTPAAVGAAMVERGMDDYTLTVFEELGVPEERIGRHAPNEAAVSSFSPLNLVYVERNREPEISLGLGIPDADFLAEGGLITKGPARAAGLGALRIRPGDTVWDIGAGCGSVSVEAAYLSRTGPVYAVEKVADRVDMIRKNIRRTGAWTVEAVHGEMPGVAEHLPDPDRIFIGGGLGRTPATAETAIHRLKPGGRITMHCILLESLNAAISALKEAGCVPEVIQLGASASDALGGGTRLKAMNPVFIVSADKTP